ncbi:MAG: glycine cleavage system protein T [Candidatus Margulisbacteria bacterium GWF2_35_9]|nr:MAG: glycine cleavage system protein T [Candidatus Margulisbacteria bacterium GWF2_35_9]
MKKTTLNKIHRGHKAKMVDYFGWEMPISYAGILEEHKAVREKAAIFDVSHMGIIEVYGPESKQFLQHLTVNDIGQLQYFHSQYSMMLDNEGNILDDMIITRLKEKYRIVVNCSNFQKIKAWMEQVDKETNFDIWLKIRDELSIVALQGPDSHNIIEKIIKHDERIPRFSARYDHVGDHVICISHTGYTGSDGYEIFVGNDFVEEFWNMCIQQGAVPAGLGSRDTLRIEAGLPLYGNEISPSTTPYDIGYGWIVKLSKNNEFKGKQFLSNVQSKTNKMYGVVIDEKAIPRTGCIINGVGKITSGTYSPTLKKSIAIFMADREINAGETVNVMIRDKEYKGIITKLPFIKKSS